MTIASDTVRDYYTKRLKEFTAARYALYLANEDPEETHPAAIELGESVARAPRTKLPKEVRAAYAYYRKHLMDEDIGWAHVYRVPIQDTLTYAVRGRTEGDDGWLECFDEDGRFLAAGRTYLDLVSWGDVEMLRAQVQTGERPKDLDSKKSLWKPVSS